MAQSFLQKENKALKWRHCTGHWVDEHRHLILGCPCKISNLTPALEVPVYLCWVARIPEDYSRHSHWCLQYPHLYFSWHFLLFLTLVQSFTCVNCYSRVYSTLTWQSCNRTEFKGPLWFEGSKSYPIPLLMFCLQQKAKPNLKEKLDKSCHFSFSPLAGKKVKDQVLTKYS